MLYNGPIMRTYSSNGQYKQDAARMAQAGFQVMNVQTDRVTDGCALTAILIIGLLLTPFCIGLLVLLALPTAFHTRITVYYIPMQVSGHQSMPSTPLGIPAPLTRPLLPGRSPQASMPSASSGSVLSGWVGAWAEQVRAFIDGLSMWERMGLIAFSIAVVVAAMACTLLLLQVVAH